MVSVGFPSKDRTIKLKKIINKIPGARILPHAEALRAVFGFVDATVLGEDKAERT